MKTLLLILLSTTCFSQCPEDLWKRAILIGDEPMEVQIGKDQHMVLIVFERKDASKVQTWVVNPKGTTVPQPNPIVLKEHVNDQDARIVYDPGWQKVPANPAARWLDKFHNKDVTLQYNAGVWASFKFRGRRAELIAEVCDNHPKAKVEVLKGTTVIKSEVIDMYKNTGGSATDHCPAGVVTTLFSSGDLPLDDYTIRWSLESKDMTKVPARDSFVFDGIKVYE